MKMKKSLLPFFVSLVALVLISYTGNSNCVPQENWECYSFENGKRCFPLAEVGGNCKPVNPLE